MVGAFAVVATLLYLAAQIRQNNASQRVAAKQEMTRQFADFVDFLVFHPDLESLHDRGVSEEELTVEETTTFNRMMAKASWYMAVTHFQYRMQSLARIIHELPTAIADSSENTGRAPSSCSTCCQARLRALQSAPPCVFTTLDALATTLHE